MRYDKLVESILGEDNARQEMVVKDFENPKYLKVKQLDSNSIVVIELDGDVEETPYEVEIYTILDTANQEIDPTKKKVVGSYVSTNEYRFATELEAREKFEEIVNSLDITDSEVSN